MRDRRSGNDRRTIERFKVNIEIDWEGLIGKRKGTIVDISITGCFVLCSGEVEDGEKVKIHFPLTNGHTIQLWGEVVNHTYEIGYAIRFVDLTDAEKDFIEIYVDTLRED